VYETKFRVKAIAALLAGLIVVLLLGWLNAMALSRTQNHYYVPLCLEVPSDGR
jgi:multisubunit Na+/H+ antiporter MnhB subunit